MFQFQSRDKRYDDVFLHTLGSFKLTYSYDSIPIRVLQNLTFYFLMHKNLEILLE